MTDGEMSMSPPAWMQMYSKTMVKNETINDRFISDKWKTMRFDMRTMRSILLVAGKITGAGIISVILLSLFVYVYCDSGVHIRSRTGETDWHYAPRQKAINYEEGFGHLRMDENGYNNEEAYSSADIILLGSSHMEAANVNGEENTAYILKHLISKNVYNLGISGHTIYHISSNLPCAISRFEPSTIIIETDTLALNVDKMIRVRERTFPNIKVYDTGILYYVQKYLPAVKFIFNKVDLWKKADSNPVQKQQTDYASPNYTEQLNLFLAKIHADAENLDVIIFYHPKTTIDRDGFFVDSTDPDARTAFITACKKNNITFLDMTDAFERLYNERHILAHGFANSAVGYGHLNKYGHHVIAQELARVIQAMEK